MNAQYGVNTQCRENAQCHVNTQCRENAQCRVNAQCAVLCRGCHVKSVSRPHIDPHPVESHTTGYQPTTPHIQRRATDLTTGSAVCSSLVGGWFPPCDSLEGDPLESDGTGCVAASARWRVRRSCAHTAVLPVGILAVCVASYWGRTAHRSPIYRGASLLWLADSSVTPLDGSFMTPHFSFEMDVLPDAGYRFTLQPATPWERWKSKQCERV